MRLVKGNVERVTTNQAVIKKLKGEGFREMEKKTEKKASDIQKVDLSELTVTELRKVAKENGLEGCASLNKEQLLKVLEDVN